MMKGQLAGLMKQAQAMQDNLKKAQEELANIEVEGQSGAGLVKVTMTCKHDVKRVEIDPSLLTEEKDMLEDLVAAAQQQQEAEQIILNDPFVQRMQRDFGAKIVPGSIKPVAKH